VNIPLFFSTIAAVLFVLAADRYAPLFFRSTGLLISVFFAASALFLTFRNKVRYANYIRSVSWAVVLFFSLFLISIPYSKRRMQEELQEYKITLFQKMDEARESAFEKSKQQPAPTPGKVNSPSTQKPTTVEGGT
jgi:hypothetical protein